MSLSKAIVGLLVVTLAIGAAILVGDVGTITVVNRELLVLGLLAATALVIQSVLAWRAARGQTSPIVFVREGVVRRASGQSSVGDHPRSVSLAVESGQAVILERNGLFARVLSPGTSRLQRGETVYKVVSTQPRALMGTVQCDTRDGMAVNVDFEIFAQIMPRADFGGAAEPLAAGPRPGLGALFAATAPSWSQDALIRAAYETHSWQSAALGQARSALREQFSRSYIADFYLAGVPAEETVALESLQTRCRRRLSDAGTALGISISEFQITHLRLPIGIAAGSLSTGGARQSAGSECHTDISGDAPRRPPAAILLASVLGGGPFATFRQAMRARTGDVTVPDVLLEGQRWVGRAYGQADPIPYELRPDRMHFDVQIHGRGFHEAGLCDGEHALFASLPEPADGDIVAVALDGRLELRRYRREADHILLEPERESQPSLALAASDDLAATLRARFHGNQPPIEVRQASAVKILGRAAVAFRSKVSASRGDADCWPLHVEPKEGPDPDSADTFAPRADDLESSVSL